MRRVSGASLRDAPAPVARAPTPRVPRRTFSSHPAMIMPALSMPLFPYAICIASVAARFTSMYPGWPSSELCWPMKCFT